jgi:hypothetical protein
VKRTGALLTLLVPSLLTSLGCIDFRKDLEDFCTRTGRCAGDSGPGGGMAGNGGSGGSGGSVATGGGTGGASGGAGGGAGGSMMCRREACEIASYMFSSTLLWTTTASSERDVWLAGDAVYHFDGTQLQTSTNPSQLESIYALSATAPDDVWLSGYSYPNAYHYDGTDWRAKKFDGGSSAYSIFARARDDAYLCSGADLFHWDGGAWEHFFTNAADDTFYDLYGAPGSPVFAVANNLVYRIDGLTVTVESPGNLGSESLYALYVTPSGQVWAVGSRLTVVHRGLDAGWSALSVDVGTSFATLLGVWARSDDDVWMAGEFGNLIHWRADAGFTSRGSEAFDGGFDLTQVTWQDAWGGGNDLWVVGTTGVGGQFSDYDGGVAAHFFVP